MVKATVLYCSTSPSAQNVSFCQKSAALQKAMVKKDVKSKVGPRNSCDGRLMVKILITTIHVPLAHTFYSLAILY